MSACEDQDKRDMDTFKTWKKDYGKEYATLDEENMRFKTFQQTLRKIESVKEYGLNQFSDMTYPEFASTHCFTEVTDSDEDENPADVKRQSYEKNTKEEYVTVPSLVKRKSDEKDTKEEDVVVSVKCRRIGCDHENDTKEEDVAVPMKPKES